MRIQLIISLLLAMFVAGATFGQGIEIGGELPLRDHTLIHVDGSSTSIGALIGNQGVAVVFWSHTCPWVRRYEDRISTLVQDFSGGGLTLILVNPNDALQSPGDSREVIGEHLAEIGYVHPYLIDEGAVLARAFGATRTPQVYLFDANGRLVYEGAIDDSPSDPGGVADAYFHDALSAVASGGTISTVQTRSFGCNIKFP